MTRIQSIVSLSLIGGIFFLPAGGFSLLAEAPKESAKSDSLFVPASNSAFNYEGRIDRRDPDNVVLIWQSSQVRVAFEGELQALVFGAATGQCFFNLEIDGRSAVLEVKAGSAPVRIANPIPVQSGQHQLTLYKRSEADAGHVAFQGIILGKRGAVASPAAQSYKLALQFFGDSITVGACNEDGALDQWETRATHNSALSYAALTAKALGASCRNVSVSGMGIVLGYVPKRAGQIWDRLYPEVNSPKSNETNWSPNIVFVNYGENDNSFSHNHGLPFPEDFSDGYVALVRLMREAYPKAEIVLLRGGMFGGAKSVVLRQAWEKAVGQLEGQDPHVHHFVFTHWSETHPRVSDDQAMADELVAWLKQQDFVRAQL